MTTSQTSINNGLQIAYKINLTLSLTGSAKQGYVCGNCNCGKFSAYRNTSGKGGITGSSRESIKEAFKSHKEAAKAGAK